jgi:predicted naringenin-chalcone synthase
MAKITSIATATPPYKISQNDVFAFMQPLFKSEALAHKVRSIYHNSGIEYRYTSLPDFIPHTKDKLLFENITNSVLLEKRMKVYEQESLRLSELAINKLFDESEVEPKSVTHLITVSCTGFMAPGLDILLARSIKLNVSVERTSVNFMGCYAALHALKHASYICKSNPQSKVLIVCVELCTLHFQSADDMDTLTSNAIFGDGVAACLVSDQEDDSNGYLISNHYSELYYQGIEDMEWKLSSHGFLMTLTSRVPLHIKNSIAALAHRSLSYYNISLPEIDTWALHPGGRKILDCITQELSLQPEQVNSSYHILKEYGNMSSATILFVLKHILENKPQSKQVMAMAFGPGLTMETMLLEKV